MRRSIRNTVLILMVSLFAAVMTVSVTGAQGLRHTALQQSPPPPPPPMSGTPVIGTPLPAKKVKLSYAFHVLTVKQRKQILAIVHKDKSVKKLLQHRNYKVTAVVNWVNKSAQQVGGVVSLRFKAPQTINGTFVELLYNCASTSYKRIVYSAKYMHVTTLTLSVDIHHKKVEGVAPLGYVVGKIRYQKPPTLVNPTPAACH